MSYNQYIKWKVSETTGCMTVACANIPNQCRNAVLLGEKLLDETHDCCGFNHQS
jgi:hypothetical protein